MYDNSGSVALGGGAGALGVLAFTGFSVMFFALVAFTLIVAGLLLWRFAAVKVEAPRRGPRPGPASAGDGSGAMR